MVEASEYQPSNEVVGDEYFYSHQSQSHPLQSCSLNKKHRPGTRCFLGGEHWRAYQDARKRREGILSISQDLVQPQIGMTL